MTIFKCFLKILPKDTDYNFQGYVLMIASLFKLMVYELILSLSRTICLTASPKSPKPGIFPFHGHLTSLFSPFKAAVRLKSYEMQSSGGGDQESPCLSKDLPVRGTALCIAKFKMNRSVMYHFYKC